MLALGRYLLLVVLCVMRRPRRRRPNPGKDVLPFRGAERFGAQSELSGENLPFSFGASLRDAKTRPAGGAGRCPRPGSLKHQGYAMILPATSS